MEAYEAKYFDSYGESFNPSDNMSGGKISLSSFLNDHLNIFVSVARGFNQGGFNLNLGLDPNSQNNNLYFDPEFLTNYEFGLNAKTFDSKINISSVIFYSDRSDQQVLISLKLIQPIQYFFLLTQNAAKEQILDLS